MIDISYTVSRPEYIEAQRLFIGRRRRKSLYWRLVIYAVFVIGCVLVVWTSKDDRRGAIDFIATMAFVLIGVVTLIRLSQKYFLVKRFATESRFLSGIHLTIDDSGLHGIVEGIGESTTQWGALTAWAEGANVFLLISGFTFRPIPKRVLSPDQQTELRDLLKRHIATAKPT
jgi:hypothetical protein